MDEGKKLFFHTSEVEGGEILQQGDEVEFVVVTNKRTGKHSACCVRKLRCVCDIDIHRALISIKVQYFPASQFNLMNSFIISLQFFKKTRKVGFQIENNEN